MDTKKLSAAAVDETTSAALSEEATADDTETQITREQRRSRRKRDVRARTISVKRMTKRELEIGRLLYPDLEYWKPRQRTECQEASRPCPFVSCKYHLYVDVSPRTGAIKLNFPDLEVWNLTESCALDVADRGGTTLEDVGAIMNLTRERIRQVEVKALAKLEALQDMLALRDFIDEGPVGKRRLPVLSKAELGQTDDQKSDDEADDDDDNGVSDDTECDSRPSAEESVAASDSSEEAAPDFEDDLEGDVAFS